MRFAIVVVAGLIGWLWFATREPDAPKAPAVKRVRKAAPPPADGKGE